MKQSVMSEMVIFVKAIHLCWGAGFLDKRFRQDLSALSLNENWCTWLFLIYSSLVNSEMPIMGLLEKNHFS